MNFKTTYLRKPVEVDYSFATEPHESLDGVTITYEDGEQIDYDAITTKEWVRLHNEMVTDLEGNAIDACDGMELNWD